MKQSKKTEGFVLIEALLGLALFVIYVAAFFPIIVGIREVPFFAGNRDRGIFICEEGLEAVRNIRDADFLNLTNGTHGLAVSGNEWVLSGSFDNVGAFSREITIEDVDANTKSVTCNVTWNQTAAKSATIELVTYFSNWKSEGFDGDCDWSELSVPSGGTYDYPGNDDGVKVMAQGDYAYSVIASGGDTYDFAVHDVSDPENVTLASSLSIGSGASTELTNIFVRGDYAYVTSRNDSAELYIIDVSVPGAPVVASPLGFSGGADAEGVFVVGDYAYVVREGSNSSNEFMVVDISTAITPSLLGSADLGGNGDGGLEVFVMDNYAYVASEESGAQLKIVDVTDSINPNYLLTSGYSLSQSSNQDGVTIVGFDDTIVLGGSDGYVYLIDVTDPLAVDQLSEISYFDAGDSINDLNVASYNGVKNGVVFIVSAINVNDELQVIDITTPATPVSLSSYQFGSAAMGIDFNKTTCSVYVVNGSNADPEFNILLAGDLVAPAATTTLLASNPSGTTIDLDWTAPGDDGSLGTATTYDIRYSTSIITEGNWASATQATGEPTPSVAGTAESFTVTGLDAATTYYFAIKTIDDASNESDISNVPSELTTGGAPVNIFVETFPNSDTAWDGSADTAQDMANWSTIQGVVDTNDIRVTNNDVGSSPSGGNHLRLHDADEGFGAPENYDMAFVSIDLSDYTDVNLEYYWQSDDVDAGEGLRVAYSTDTINGTDGTWTQIAEYLNPTDDVWNQATYVLDDVDAVSTFVLRFSSYSNANQENMYVDDIKLTGIYTPDLVSPSAISDLALSGATGSSIDLDWTATGDDAGVGTATSYDIRYSTSTITELNWASATEVTGEPNPSVSGSAESMTVSGLSPNTLYYFAIKAIDGALNSSSISNVPSLSTTAPSPTIIFNETFSNSDGAWNGSGDTAQDEATWSVYQGNGDSNDVQISDEDSGTSISGGTHLTFEDSDHGFQDPEIYDIAYIPVDLSGYNTVEIKYNWQSDDVDGDEGMRVAYSTDTTDGTDGTWTQIAEYLNPTDDVWTLETYNLADIDAVSTFVLRFSSYSTANGEHMYVDDITITATPDIVYNLDKDKENTFVRLLTEMFNRF